MRILIVDDHEIVRKGLVMLLEGEEGLEVVGEAGTAEEAIRRVGYDSPEVVVMDVRLPDGTGIEACREIRERWPEVRVLMLTSFADEEALFASIVAGAAGYVLKRVDARQLIDSIRRVGAGESLLDPTMTEHVFRRIRGDEPTDPLIARLSPQERNILDLISEGLTNKEIAERLFLAEKTVKNYVSNLLNKLGMTRRTEAAAFSARLAAKREREYAPEQWGDALS